MLGQTDLKNIRTIARKELRGFFNYPFAYVLMVIFVSVSFYLYFKTIFLFNEASLRPYFDVLPLLLILFVPAITMRALAQEQKEGTIELLITQPISELDYLLGKYLGNLMFLLITLLTTLSLAATLIVTSSPDVGVMVSQYIGAGLFLGALTAIGIWASSLTRNQTVAFLVAVVTTAAFIISGNELVVSSMPYPIGDILSLLSLQNHFSAMERGVINIKEVFYFISFTVVFLALAFSTLVRQKYGRGTSQHRKTLFAAVVVTVVAGVLIFSGNIFSVRIDLTANKLFSLSPGTVEVVKNLEKPVSITVYESRELPSGAELIARDVKDFLNDYRVMSGGKVKVVYKDPDADRKIAEEAAQAGVRPVQFNVVRENEFQAKNGYFGLAVKYEKEADAIPFIERLDDFEYGLTSMIQRLSDPSMVQVTFAAGHGEKTVGDEYEPIATAISDRYILNTWYFSTSDATVPVSTDVLIVAGPKESMPEAKRQAIATYLKSGGEAIFMIDTVNAVPDMLMALPQPNSFADFLSPLGITVNTDIVYDMEANETVNFNSQQGQQVLFRYPFWVRAPSSNKLVVNKGIDGVVFPWASSITLDDVKLQGAKTTFLYGTSEFGNVQTPQFSNFDETAQNNLGTNQTFNIQPNDNPSFSVDTYAPAGLAVVIDGTVPTSNNPDIKGRIIVIGDSDFTSQRFFQNSTANLAFFLNSIDWLAQNDSLIGIRSKNTRPRALDIESESARDLVKYLNLLGVPVLIGLYGAVRYQRRRRLSMEEFEEDLSGDEVEDVEGVDEVKDIDEVADDDVQKEDKG